MEYFLIHECHVGLGDMDDFPMDLAARLIETHAWLNRSPYKEEKSQKYEVIDEITYGG